MYFPKSRRLITALPAPGYTNSFGHHRESGINCCFGAFQVINIYFGDDNIIALLSFHFPGYYISTHGHHANAIILILQIEGDIPALSITPVRTSLLKVR